MAVVVNDDNFDEIVLKGDKPTLVDFWGEGCGPCKMMLPIIDELGAEYGDKLMVVKIDVDNCQGVVMKFGIRSIPTILLIKDGDVKEKLVGAVPKGVLADKIKAFLG